MDLHPTPDVSAPTFMSIGSWSAQRGQDAPPHRHGSWKVTYYRSGRIDSIVDGTSFEATPGTVLVLPPNALHAEIAHTAYSNYYLLVDAPVNQPWPPACFADTAHDVGWLLAAMLREESLSDDYSEAITPSLLKVLDLTLRRAHPGERPSPMQAIVRAVEQLFEETYSTRISITEVSHQVGVSPSSLRHYFSTIRGVSPQEGLQQVRLRHALALLRSSDLPLMSIAERCGFHSASHLSRRIKSATGSSPGHLR